MKSLCSVLPVINLVKSGGTDGSIRRLSGMLFSFPKRGSSRRRTVRSISTTFAKFKLVAVKTPNFPESITEGDVRWSKSVGSQVKVDDVIGEVETDKTSLPIVSPSDGILAELLVSDGSKVAKGQTLCNIDSDAATQTKSEPAPVTVDTVTFAVRETSKPTQKPNSVSETPKKGQEIIGSINTNCDRMETRVPMTRIRRTIASRLKEAQNTTAMLTTFNEIDMTRAIQLRTKHKERVMKMYGVRLGFMSTFLQAAVYALKMQPVLNSVIDGDDIVTRNYVDISVAVSSPKGLVVPVVRNAHLMNSIEMETAVAELAEKARNNQLAIEDMEGGTFTVSNGGVFGSLLSTPIINLPQSAILGMHSIQDRPVAVDGKVEVRPMMYVALSYDHRLIDGREAVTFLKRIKDVVEDPATAILGL